MIKLLRRTICLIAGHKYFLLKTFSSDTRCVGCKGCDISWAMNDHLRILVRWDSSFALHYARFYFEVDNDA